jgi:hypothetical protein
MTRMLADAAPPVSYTGRTAEDRRIVVEVRKGAVVSVRAGITKYPCATFGDVGPLVVHESGNAPIARDGRFWFSAGESAQRITVSGVLGKLRAGGRRRMAGTVRVHGSIATGQKCASATLRFTAAHA